MVKNLPANAGEAWFGKMPWRGKWQPTPVFLPGGSHGQRSLVDYSPWVCKEAHMTTTGTFMSGKGMVFSSFLSCTY